MLKGVFVIIPKSYGAGGSGGDGRDDGDDRDFLVPDNVQKIMADIRQLKHSDWMVLKDLLDDWGVDGY